MRRVTSGYPAAGDGFWSDPEDGKEDLLIQSRGPTNWRLVAVIVTYGALVFLVGLLLAG